MIKIKPLVKCWVSCEYDNEAVTEEYQRLHNSMWALYENGLITGEQRDTEIKKLNKALEQFEAQTI